MKTAINWLLDELKNLSESQLQHKDFQLYMQKQDIIINNAKEKEKEQIIDAHTNGHNDCYEYNFLKNSANEISIRNGEDYYNETYNQNK